MTVIVIVICCCATIAFVADRFEAVWQRAANRRADDARALESRRLDLQEREVAIKEKLAKTAIVPTIPPDLLNRVRMWDDPAAQDAERATLRELYEDYGDWDIVRQKLTPLNAVMSTEIAAPRDGLVM